MSPGSAPRWRLPLLLVLLAGSLIWSLAPQDTPAPRPAPPRRAAADAPGPTLAQPARAPATDTDTLRPPQPQALAAGLFGASTTSRPPSAAATPPPQPAAASAVPVIATAPPPAAPPPWQALGVLRERGQAPQALLQIDGQVLSVRPGEPMPAGWRLDAITATHVELSREDGTQRQRLPVQPGD